MSASKKAYYSGLRFAPYDLVREFLLALLVVSTLVVVLSAALSSPDVPPITLKSIALNTPKDFTSAALAELDGSSDTAGYGPPYNGADGSQNFGFFSPQKWVGVHIRINTARDFVLDPLARASGADPALSQALTQFKAASPSQQASWESAESTALDSASEHGSQLTLASCACGPVSLMMSRELALGQSGAMDGLLLTSGHFYQTDYTRPVLFAADTGALDTLATKYNLQGDTWGAMNETGNYPGQEWLWLFSAFYQVPPFSGPLHLFGGVVDWSPNADLMAVIFITILTLLLLLIPWIPGLNRLPRYLGVYKLIWRDHYRETRGAAARRTG